jgi:hypothetical protein
VRDRLWRDPARSERCGGFEHRAVGARGRTRERRSRLVEPEQAPERGRLAEHPFDERCKAGTSFLDSVLIYDPATAAWISPLFKLSTPRASHASVAFADGRVLLAGGTDGKVFTSSLEILQPKTGTVTPLAGKLSKGRIEPTAHALADGRILFLGGWCGFDCAVTSNDLYDPKTDQVSAVSHLGDVPAFHAAVALQDGRILAIGGVTDRAAPKAIDTVVAFSAAGWQPMPPLAKTRQRPTATLLADGTALVVGGMVDFGQAHLAVAERLYP